MTDGLNGDVGRGRGEEAANRERGREGLAASWRGRQPPLDAIWQATRLALRARATSAKTRKLANKRKNKSKAQELILGVFYRVFLLCGGARIGYLHLEKQ